MKPTNPLAGCLIIKASDLSGVWADGNDIHKVETKPGKPFFTFKSDQMPEFSEENGKLTILIKDPTPEDLGWTEFIKKIS